MRSVYAVVQHSSLHDGMNGPLIDAFWEQNLNERPGFFRGATSKAHVHEDETLVACSEFGLVRHDLAKSAHVIALVWTLDYAYIVALWYGYLYRAVQDKDPVRIAMQTMLEHEAQVGRAIFALGVRVHDEQVITIMYCGSACPISLRQFVR